MKMRRLFAGLTAAVSAAAVLTAAVTVTASAADGAGGFSWEKTEGYHMGTETVTDKDGKTVVTFKDADDGENAAGFCAQDGSGWDWSDYTQLSFTLQNDSETDISFALALGTGADWNWYQSNINTSVGAGKSVDLTYYLKSEEWSFDGTVSAVADLFAVHRINMMVLPTEKGKTVSGGVTVSDLKLGGSASANVEAKNGFYVDGYVLRDANQNPFIMRGTNYAYTWYSWDGLTEKGLQEIADYGANTVRIVLGDGDQYTKNTSGEIANLIQICEKNKLVAVFEVHDATGKDDAQPLLNAAKYFANDIASALKGHEDTCIINIANEWQGNTNNSAWQAAYTDAVKIIRDAGLKHCIMCDAGGWGQGYSTVVSGGAAVLKADPEHNCMFSVHMYGTAGGSKSTIKTVMDSMKTRELCLVIGEFGYKHSDGDVDEAYIMEYAQETGTGWMSWSWYGNGSPVEYLDMSNKNAGGTLSKEWGEVVINGKNGWKETAQPASVFTAAAQTTKPVTTTTVTTTTTTETTTTTTESTTAETTTAETTTVTEQPKATLLGDATMDGDVDVSDAVLIARIVNEDKTAKITDAGMLNADVNQNGQPDSDDMTMILLYIARQITSF